MCVYEAKCDIVLIMGLSDSGSEDAGFSFSVSKLLIFELTYLDFISTICKGSFFLSLSSECYISSVFEGNIPQLTIWILNLFISTEMDIGSF
jgi:hypothetical protein